MKLHALNENIVNYGFPLEIEDKNEDFHGHSRGILFALTDADGTVIENHMPQCDDPDKSLADFINDQRFTKLTQQFFTTNKDGEIKESIGYYVPYYVVGHSMFMPTLNYDNIIDDGEHINYADIEIILAYHGWNRYITAHVSTVDIPIFIALYESLAPAPTGDDTNSKEFMKSLGVKLYNGDDPHVRYTLDFYNEIGETKDVGFYSPVDICRYIISARIIGLKWREKKEDE